MKVRRTEGLPFQRLGEEVLVVVPRDRNVHLLNETSARIWDLLEHPATMEEVLAALLEVYDVPEAKARREVSTLIGELKRKGLLEEVSE